MENKVMTTSDDDDMDDIKNTKVTSTPQINLTTPTEKNTNANSLPAKLTLSDSKETSSSINNTISPKKSKSAASNIGSLFRRPSLTKNKVKLKYQTHRRLKSVEVSPSIDETPKLSKTVKQSATTNCLDIKNLENSTKNSDSGEAPSARKSASLPRDYNLKEAKNNSTSDSKKDLYQKSRSKKFYKSKKSVESSASSGTENTSRSVSRSQSGNDIVDTESQSKKEGGGGRHKKFRAGVIGVELEECQKRLQGWDRLPIPVPIREVIDELESKKLDTENLYKIHPTKTKSQLYKLVQEYEDDSQPDLEKFDAHILASFIKLFLRDLPTHILTSQLLPKFEHIISKKKKVRNEMEWIAILNRDMIKLIGDLPSSHQALLALLSIHWSNVIKNVNNKVSLKGCG